MNEDKPRIYPLKNGLYNRVGYWILKDNRNTVTYGTSNTYYQRNIWFTIGRSSMTWRCKYLQYILELITRVSEVGFDTESNAIYFEITNKQADYLKSLNNTAGVSWTLYRNALRDDKPITMDTIETHKIAAALR